MIGHAGPLEYIPFLETVSTLYDVWVIMGRVSDICKIDAKELVSMPHAQATVLAIHVLRIGRDRYHEACSRASFSRDVKADKGKVVVYCPPIDDEENDENADLIAPDKYTPLLGDSFPPYRMEYGSSSRAGGDLTSEVDFIEPSSHCPFPETVATGCDDSASAYAEYKAFAEQYPFTPVDAYIPRPDEEYPATELASSGGQPFCDQLLSWGVMDSNSIAATSSPFLSWDGLGSPFFTSQAYSAFQVGDTVDGDGLFGQTSYDLNPFMLPVDGGDLDQPIIDHPLAFQEFHAEGSNSVQPLAPEAEAEGGNLPYSNPPPSDFDDGGSPPLGLEAYLSMEWIGPLELGQVRALRMRLFGIFLLAESEQ
ncbi:hypothetical protein Taro_041131 [Colocasia esculenta]|uniref:Uncharacterized protein n=1 Tax=Colocasia esculenta TaxID=4460 RepID=A0A843WKQ7_COLES|nr:hypothetical protein [Colocasia esculenta]